MFSSDEDAGDGAIIHIDATARHAVITWPPGVPVFNPWMTTMEMLLANPDFQPEFAVISDWRHASGAPDQAFVDSFLVFCQSVRRARRLTGRWATVISTPIAEASGMGRTAELQASESGSDYRVFTDLDAALTWADGL